LAFSYRQAEKNGKIKTPSSVALWVMVFSCFKWLAA
jgi:hypothetical protein